jgi:hypothetical protein
MSKIVRASFETDRAVIEGSEFEINRLPDSCPQCHKGIEPIWRFGWEEKEYLQLILQCPKTNCRELFIAYYHREQERAGYPTEYIYIYHLRGLAPWSVEEKDFTQEVMQISEKFPLIYNQAKEAENRGLKEICGAGYRRALEFLIKDYLKKEGVEKSKIIEATPLGTCIERYVTSERIKDCAKRAAWLGNDETHYIRKWKDKDLEDLKDLIQLTVNWIQDEHLTKKIKADMPDKRSQKKKQK